MTGYHLSIGYNSGCSSLVGDYWSVLVEVVSKLRVCQELIVQDAMVSQPHLCESLVRECADTFKPDADGCTLTINKADVMLLASGGGEYRPIKEATRRAFCRLVIEEMHKHGIEVNLTVA